MTATLEQRSQFASGPNTGRKIKNGVAGTLVFLAFGIACVPLVWLLWTVVSKGLTAVTSSGWWSSDLGTRTFSDSGGGAFHAIIGTLELIAICSVVAVPIAVLVGIYLIEYGHGWLARVTTFMVDILTGVPSIVAAIFIYAVFLKAFGFGFAGVWAALALVLLMIPVVVRTTEEMLRLVPNELREASYALGVPKWKTVLKVVLPTAMSGIITGIVLGVARIAGETAPLLVLVKYEQQTNYNPFSGFQASLPLMINDQVKNLGQGTVSFNGTKQANFAPDRMWGAALTLIVIIMLLNLIARLVARRSTISN